MGQRAMSAHRSLRINQGSSQSQLFQAAPCTGLPLQLLEGGARTGRIQELVGESPALAGDFCAVTEGRGRETCSLELLFVLLIE